MRAGERKRLEMLNERGLLERSAKQGCGEQAAKKEEGGCCKEGAVAFKFQCAGAQRQVYKWTCGPDWGRDGVAGQRSRAEGMQEDEVDVAKQS